PNRRWAGDLRVPAGLDDERAGGYQAAYLRVPELVQQTPDTAIDRLPPQLLAGLEVAADQGRVDPNVYRGAVERQKTTLAVADHPDLTGLGAGLLGEPVDGREHLLDLVPHHVTAHLEGAAVDELAVRLVRHPHLRGAGPGIAAVDQHRDQHAA